MVEFDWDEANVRHLRRHRIRPEEFEQVLNSDPLSLEYQAEDGEERYKSLGYTQAGRLLVVVWTIRGTRVRAITVYPAGNALRRALRMYGG